jgi:hypothetical protein
VSANSTTRADTVKHGVGWISESDWLGSKIVVVPNRALTVLPLGNKIAGGCRTEQSPDAWVNRQVAEYFFRRSGFAGFIG